MRSTKMDLRVIAINRINPAPYNPRKDLRPEDAEYRKLLRSMDEFGCVEPLVWNKWTGHLVGGHQRFKILLAKGIKRIEVSVVDLPPAKEKALNVALNKVSGDWDRDKLADLLDELARVPGVDVEATGFDTAEIEQLVDVAGVGLGDDEADWDAAPDRDAPVVTRPGELIELGEHRLLCGDATRRDDCERLLDGARADLLFTDPPYNVAYSARNRPTSVGKGKKRSPAASGIAGAASGSSRASEGTSGGSGGGGIRNDNLGRKQYDRWLTGFLEVASEALRPGGSFYIFNGHANFGLMHDELRRRKLHPSCVITWAKESFAPGFGDYNEQTEFCLYGWKRGAKRVWRGPKNESTLWTEHRDRTGDYAHPTQKALVLADRAIRNSSRPDGLVFDPFLGSGTTLIAAARRGRRGYGMEIEPKYCDVIVRRYIALVGEKYVPRKLVRRFALEQRSS